VKPVTQEAKPRVDQVAYRRAMRDQGKTKPEYFAVNNRKARRLAAALKSKT
jgi:hypothetical protein